MEKRRLMPANDNGGDASLKRARALLASRLGREVSEEEAQLMSADLVGFFRVLAAWARAECAAPANDNNHFVRRGEKGEGDES